MLIETIVMYSQCLDFVTCFVDEHEELSLVVIRNEIPALKRFSRLSQAPVGVPFKTENVFFFSSSDTC